MDERKLLTDLSLPKATWFLRNLPFQQLSQRLSLKNRKLLSESIESFGIRVLATIKPANTNIPMYEDDNEKYEEIHLYKIKLTNWRKRKEVYRIIAQIIPYPLVIIFYQGDQSEWMLAKYRKHTDGVNLMIEKIYQSNSNIEKWSYIEQLNFQKLSKLNLKLLYESIISVLVEIELKENYEVELREYENEASLDKLKKIDETIIKLQKQARSEMQINQRLPLHMAIHQLKQEKEKIIKG